MLRKVSASAMASRRIALSLMMRAYCWTFAAAGRPSMRPEMYAAPPARSSASRRVSSSRRVTVSMASERLEIAPIAS